MTSRCAADVPLPPCTVEAGGHHGALVVASVTVIVSSCFHLLFLRGQQEPKVVPLFVKIEDEEHEREHRERGAQIAELQTRVGALERHFRGLQSAVTELYFAPGMPGYVAADGEFRWKAES